MVVFTVPKADAEVIDNWHVAGLAGHREHGLRVVSDLFVPAAR